MELISRFGLGGTIRIALNGLEALVSFAKFVEKFSHHFRQAVTILFDCDLGAELLPTFWMRVLHSATDHVTVKGCQPDSASPIR